MHGHLTYNEKTDQQVGEYLNLISFISRSTTSTLLYCAMLKAESGLGMIKATGITMFMRELKFSSFTDCPELTSSAVPTVFPTTDPASTDGDGIPA